MVLAAIGSLRARTCNELPSDIFKHAPMPGIPQDHQLLAKEKYKPLNLCLTLGTRDARSLAHAHCDLPELTWALI